MHQVPDSLAIAPIGANLRRDKGTESPERGHEPASAGVLILNLPIKAPASGAKASCQSIVSTGPDPKSPGRGQHSAICFEIKRALIRSEPLEHESYCALVVDKNLF